MGHSRCKGPESRPSMARQKNSREPGVSAVESARGREGRVEVRSTGIRAHGAHGAHGALSGSQPCGTQCPSFSYRYFPGPPYSLTLHIKHGYDT